MRRAYFFAIPVALASTHAGAEWPAPDGADLTDPANWPDDPGYGGQWNFWSFIAEEAQDTVNEYEMDLGSGMHIDRAWQRTIGDPRVVIAVLDSGIRWREDELVTKYYLNAEELPSPDAACRTGDYAGDPDDANGDGLFSMLDWAAPSGDGLPRDPCDPGVTDQNGNGLVDPQDLIAVFSDGTDADENGYVDDISGWDTYRDDNDANDDTEAGHGTGEASDSAGATNNGRGDAGVCPLCRVLMVRVGDHFVVDVNDYATGVIYAVDAGATLIQGAQGSIDNSPLSWEAIDYAYANDAVIIQSAGDEDSFHHEYPGSNQHTVYVHAITHDTSGWEDATSYLAFNNCSNYGVQLALSASGSACSSEATGKLSGIAGLLYSAALGAGVPLPRGEALATDPRASRRITAEEAKQLLVTTVDDIAIPGSESDPAVYPSREGFDLRFGYGRPNVRTAVDAIFDGRIPPEVDIDEPRWFEVVDPAVTKSLALVGHASFREDRYDSMDYVIEYATGGEPDDDPDGGDWTVIDSGTWTDPFAGTLATWDISDLVVENPDQPEPDVAVNRHLVTVRIRAIAHSPTLGDAPGVMRKSFHVFHDDDMLPGYPVFVGASGESGVKIVDVNGDGAEEILMADSDGRVHAFGPGGEELPEWPAFTDVVPAVAAHADAAAYASGAVGDGHGSFIIGSPAVADLDGDGDVEVVAGTYDGWMHVFEADASERAGFPVEVDRENSAETDPDHELDGGFAVSPVLADLDGDGALEIVAGAMDGWLYAWRSDGSAQPGFPVRLSDGDLQNRVMSQPAVGDVDGDGVLEIALGTNEDYDKLFGPLYLVRADGSYVPGWPQRLLSVRILPLVGQGLPNAPAMADVDGDGDDEIMAAGTAQSPLLFRDPAGDPEDQMVLTTAPFGVGTTSDDAPALTMVTNGSFGDLDADGVPEYVQPTAGFGAANAFAGSGVRGDFDHHVTAWRVLDDGKPSGRILDGWPRRTDSWQFFMSPTIADIDGDGLPEAIVGSAGYYVHAWNFSGQEPAGWPKFTGQWIISPAAVGDVGGDGVLDVAVSTRAGFLYAWRTDADAATACFEWESFRHDDRNTGNWGTPLSSPRCAAGGPEADGGTGGDDGGDDGGVQGGGDGGCCRVGGADMATGGSALPVLAAVAVLLLAHARSARRRRR